MKRYALRIYAEKNGIDISADKRRVTAFAIGSQEKDTLYAL